MRTRRPVGPVGLALRKVGGAAGADQLAATTGLARHEVLRELQRLSVQGLVVESDGVWHTAQLA